MKKNFKLALALVLALSLFASMSAMAASIQITANGTPNANATARTYSAYKIFDANYTTLTSSGNTANDLDDITYTPAGAPVAYSMATDSPWLTAMQDTTNQTWFDVNLAADGSKYIITPKGTNGANIDDATEARAFGDYLNAHIPAGASPTTITVGSTATTVAPGYYLIVGKDDADAVTRVAVVTTDVTIVEKNTYITSSKTTNETSYNVGDSVNYTATVYIPSTTALSVSTTGQGGAKTYTAGHGPVILHDTMDSRLAFSNDVEATIDNAAFTGFTVNTSPTGGYTFDINIDVTNAVLGKTITFTYSAVVQDTAVTDTAFPNTLFANNNTYDTTPVTVKVYSFDLSFSKDFTDGDNTLTANFELRTTANDATTAIAFLPVSNNAQEKAESASDTGADTTITITNGQTRNLVGLKAGTYYLVETATSTGYNLLAEPITVVISDTTTDVSNPSHTVSYSGAGLTAGTGIIPVVNNHGVVLPSTGGIGTTIFYVAGSLMVLAAAILLITKRRMGAND